MGNIPPCGFFNRQQSAEQNRLFLCSVRPGLLSEMENNSLNVGRVSMVTGTSSGISPSSKWRMREQVRLTNSKSCVTIKMTFPISDSRRIRPATCVMLSKSSPLVGSSNTSRSFPQNHADRYRHPLLLTSGQGIGVAVSEWGQGQLFQCCVNKRLFRIADTECTF